jgi:hypothetical protein
MIRVGFLINFNYLKWLGGFYVIKNLIYCINTFSKKNEIEPILIVKKKLSRTEIKEFKNIKLIKTNLFYNQNLIQKIYNKFLIFLFGKSKNYEFFFTKNKIDVLSHINVLSNSIFLGKNSSIKSLSFIADLQHIHYPENFSSKNLLLRNLNIRMCAAHSSKIILSGFDAKKDLKSISKSAYKKSVVNQFIFKTPRRNEIINLSSLKKKYKFSTNFFYLPNQYWAHKNHIVVLESLKHIKKKYKSNKLLVISTGHSEDHRNKNYFNKIMNFIIDNNLQDNYKYLGVVPFNKVLSFIYHSVALIHPSKFEGRSSSVEQAKSMGKNIILSNIAIHKEQNPARGIYFNPDKFLELSSIMVKTWNKYNYINDKKFINKASKKNKNSLLKYYKNYRKIITSVI